MKRYKFLEHIFPRHSLVAIYNSFDKPHLHYCDIIYDQPNNESFCNKIERFQYNAAFKTTGAIRETSQTRPYNDIGLESLKFRSWMRRLCIFYKIKILKLPKYLYYLIPNDWQIYNTRHSKFRLCWNFSLFHFWMGQTWPILACVKSLLKSGWPIQNYI